MTWPSCSRVNCALSVANLADVLDLLVRVFGHALEDVLGNCGLLEVGGLTVTPVVVRIARGAGELRAAHYGSKTCPVSMNDCIAAATALRLRASLATSDLDLAGPARARGIDVVALPDSRGRRP